ncbi:MAG: KEOPS complex subunit Cgi121 [Candidatus Nitrosocaldus sp.]
MMLRRILHNNNHIYYILLTYIDLSVDEPEEFMRRVRTLAEVLHKSIIVQVIDADNIAGLEHLLEVLTQSLEAERRSCLLAKRVEVDILLRLACTRQISDAIERVGLRRGRSKAVLVVMIHEEGEETVNLHNMLMKFKDKLKVMDGVIKVYDNDSYSYSNGVRVEGGDEGKGYKHVYEHLTSVYGLSEQELTSCISSNRLVSILAERANLLHR